MKNPVWPVKSSGGFTLAEILLAIFIFSIISVTIYSSLHSILSTTRVVERAIDRNEMAKNCLNRMFADIQALTVAMPPEYDTPDINEDADPYRIVGDTSYIGNATFPRLRFVSSAHIQFVHQRSCGVAEIVYYVQEAKGRHYILRRADHCPPFDPFEPSANDPILCDPLKSLKITYYDKDGTPYETWHSDREEFGYATPLAIDIVLEIGDDESSSIYQIQVSPRVVRDPAD